MYQSTTLEQLLHQLQAQELHLTLVRACIGAPRLCSPSMSAHDSPQACSQAAGWAAVAHDSPQL
jgi:hypothetical protein